MIPRCFILLLALAFGAARADSPADTLYVADMKGGDKISAEASGVLQNLPYHIQWFEFGSAATMLQALDAGAVDVSPGAEAPFIFSYASGAKEQVVGAYQANNGGAGAAVLVAENSPLHAVADLKGHSVTTTRGSSGHILLLRLLRQAHISPNDIKWVYLAPADSKAAFSGGSVDAWSVWEPYYSLAELQGGVRVLADGSGVSPTSVLLEMGSAQAIASKHALIEDFVHRLGLAREWASAHPQQYAQQMSQETGLPVEVSLRVAQRSQWREIPLDQKLIDDVRQTYGIYHDAGVIGGVSDFNAAFDLSFNGALGIK